jgi:hypothetical protein
MVVHDLVRRFRIIAVLNLVLAPFVIVFLFMYFFFRYAEVRCRVLILTIYSVFYFGGAVSPRIRLSASFGWICGSSWAEDKRLNISILFAGYSEGRDVLLRSIGVASLRTQMTYVTDRTTRESDEPLCLT